MKDRVSTIGDQEWLDALKTRAHAALPTKAADSLLEHAGQMPELFKQVFPAGKSLVLRDSIYRILRRMIRYGELQGKFSYSEVADKVADKLSDEEELSKHRSHASDHEALLEALAILVRDGFVQHRPEVGFEVRVATFDEVLEIFALRAKIEGRAVEKLSSKPNDYDLENDDGFDQVIKAQNNMREISDSSEFYPFKDWDTFFHIYMVIAARFGSDRAWRTIGVWRDKLQLCRTTASKEAAILSPSEKEDILDEHEAILDAVRERNSVAAVQKLDEHLNQAFERLQKALQFKPIVTGNRTRSGH